MQEWGRQEDAFLLALRATRHRDKFWLAYWQIGKRSYELWFLIKQSEWFSLLFHPLSVLLRVSSKLNIRQFYLQTSSTVERPHA